MNLKDIFSKGEGGALTYEQFMQFANEGKAKFTDLSEGNYVDKQKYTDELASRDTRITSLDETIKAREGDIETLRQQLETAGTDSSKLSELSTKFADLQKQYDKDTKAYQKQLKDQARKHAINAFADSQKFTSQAAKRDFISAMMAKDFQMENDTIIGATDFVAAYTKDNADAFVVESEQKPDANKPFFSASTNNNNGDGNGNGGNPFQFNFAGIRPHDTK